MSAKQFCDKQWILLPRKFHSVMLNEQELSTGNIQDCQGRCCTKIHLGNDFARFCWFNALIPTHSAPLTIYTTGDSRGELSIS